MAEVTPTSGEVVYTPKVLLITGAAGFIGSNATLRILREYPAYKVPLNTDTMLHATSSYFSALFSFRRPCSLFWDRRKRNIIRNTDTARAFSRQLAGYCLGQDGLLCFNQ